MLTSEVDRVAEIITREKCGIFVVPRTLVYCINGILLTSGLEQRAKPSHTEAYVLCKILGT